LVATAASGYVSYRGQQEQAAATEQVAEYNAKSKENAAIQADMEAREEIARTRRENKRILASNRAEAAKSGVQMVGSPLEVLGENAATLELQVQDKARAANAALSAGLADANATRWSGGLEAKGLRRAATGTLMSTGANLTSSFYSFRQSGAFKPGK
jgi:hypothetical protein